MPPREYTELLVGCGYDRARRLNPETLDVYQGRAGRPFPPRAPEGWANLVTLDHNQACEPDCFHDLSLPKWGSYFAPPKRLAHLFDGKSRDGRGFTFSDSVFDELHAYEVLEHVGQLGDARTFFDTFNEAWRILKCDGLLCATVPDWRSLWAFGDPGHRRVINDGSLTFLDRRAHKANILRGVSSDYRALSRCDFVTVWRSSAEEAERTGIFRFVLEAIKPERPW